MQKSGIFSKIKTPILIGGLFSAFIYIYFTPKSAHTSIPFLTFFTDRLSSAKRRDKNMQKSAFFTHSKITQLGSLCTIIAYLIFLPTAPTLGASSSYCDIQPGCTNYSGNVNGPTVPENCAKTVSGTSVVPQVSNTCYGPSADNPVIAYRECAQCAWGYKRTIAGTFIDADCSNALNYYACTPSSMATVQCYDTGYPDVSFTNRNGCARGSTWRIHSDNYGIMDEVDSCELCASGYTLEYETVSVRGCRNSFSVGVCNFDNSCSNHRDCPGFQTGPGTDVPGKPGLKQQIACVEGECIRKNRCDTDQGYYNGMLDKNKYPISCNKCPNYTGSLNAGEYTVKCEYDNPTLSGCYIVYNRTIEIPEGEFVFEEDCNY